MKKALLHLVTMRRSSRLGPAPELPYENVAFKSAHPDAITLSGWLIPHPRPRAIIILCHGMACSRSWMLPKAGFLHSLGYATLLFDFRARGLSHGSHCTLGFQECDDIRGAVDYLKARPDTKTLPLAAIGDSLGAASLVLAMAKEAKESRIQAAVLESCFPSLDQAIEARCRRFHIAHAWLGEALQELLAIETSEVSPLKKASPNQGTSPHHPQPVRPRLLPARFPKPGRRHPRTMDRPLVLPRQRLRHGPQRLPKKRSPLPAGELQVVISHHPE